MRSPHFPRPLRGLGAALGAAVLAALLGGIAGAPARAQTEWDHSKIVGAAKCAECHKVTTKIWENTHHFKTFAEMPRRKEAAEIADKMGLKRIKADSLCLDCHFTSQKQGAELEPIAGISCESCHSPAADWMKRHGEYSGKKKETETPEEAAKRWAESEAAGMIRPHMLYRLAKNCYGCHVVPKEELVNKGGHPAGSAFELVTWSQGEIRHNVWKTEGKSNPEASVERKRMMLVIGQAVELEVSLRAVGEATQKADYAVSMAKRAQRAAQNFQKIAQAINIPEGQAILEAVKGAELKLNNKGPLNAAADAIGQQARAIAEKYDGSGFGAIDSLIPGPDKYKGSPSQ